MSPKIQNRTMIQAKKRKNSNRANRYEPLLSNIHHSLRLGGAKMRRTCTSQQGSVGDVIARCG
jgi:hypothetical protein